METLLRVLQTLLLVTLLDLGHRLASSQLAPGHQDTFFAPDRLDAVDEIQVQMTKVNRDNCGIKHVSDLFMPEDTVSHIPDVKDININPVFPNRTDMLHVHNMALSRAFFFYFDANQFTNRTYFAPYAFKYDLNTRKFHVEDLARINKSEEVYTNQQWFKQLKSRWGNFYDNLEKHWLKMFFRSRSGGRDQSKFGDGTYDDIYLRRYEHFPEYYKAANLEQGIWTPPYFDCTGVGKPMWKITYASPFFGWNSL